MHLGLPIITATLLSCIPCCAPLSLDVVMVSFLLLCKLLLLTCTLHSKMGVVSPEKVKIQSSLINPFGLHL